MHSTKAGIKIFSSVVCLSVYRDMKLTRNWNIALSNQTWSDPGSEARYSVHKKYEGRTDFFWLQVMTWEFEDC